MTPLAHHNLQRRIGLDGNSGTSAATATTVGGLAGGRRRSASGVGVGSGSGHGSNVLEPILLIFIILLIIRVDRVRVGATGSRGGGSGIGASRLGSAGLVGGRGCGTTPGARLGARATGGREWSRAGCGSGGSGIEDERTANVTLGKEGTRVTSPLTNGGGHGSAAGSGFSQEITSCVDFRSQWEERRRDGTDEVVVGATPGSGDLGIGHGSGRDTEGIERVEGSGSGNASIGHIASVFRPNAEDVLIVSGHSAGGSGGSGAGDCRRW